MTSIENLLSLKLTVFWQSSHFYKKNQYKLHKKFKKEVIFALNLPKIYRCIYEIGRNLDRCKTSREHMRSIPLFKPRCFMIINDLLSISLNLYWPSP